VGRRQRGALAGDIVGAVLSRIALLASVTCGGVAFIYFTYHWARLVESYVAAAVL